MLAIAVRQRAFRFAFTFAMVTFGGAPYVILQGCIDHIEEQIYGLPMSDATAMKRLVGGVKAAGYFDAQSKIQQAFKIIDVKVFPDHIDGWKKCRNAVAHGDFDRAGPQVRLDRLGKIATLNNQMALGAIGYDGLYQDYGSQGFPLRVLKTGEEFKKSFEELLREMATTRHPGVPIGPASLISGSWW